MEAALTQPTGRRGVREGGGQGRPPRWRSDALLRTGARRHVTTAARAGWLVSHTRCDATDAADWPALQGGLAYVCAHARARTQARAPTGPRTVAACGRREEGGVVAVVRWRGGPEGSGPVGSARKGGVGAGRPKRARLLVRRRVKREKEQRVGEIPCASPRGAPAGRVGVPHWRCRPTWAFSWARLGPER